MSKRLKVRFPSTDALIASQSIESPNVDTVLQNDKRSYIAIEVSDIDGRSSSDIETFAMDAAPELRLLADEFGAEIVEDYQYELDTNVNDLSYEGIDDAPSASLKDVMHIIRANDAWQHSTGEGVTIAVVDTGVDGSHPEFQKSRQVGNWEPLGEVPWTDWQGHGTMCAAISAASDAGAGSRYRGVAPNADLIACKTRFYDSELGAIYDYLISTSQTLNGPLVATNSFGRKTGKAPPDPGKSDFLDALDDAISSGIFVFFSAGNNHARAGGDATGCDPNSVWLHKSRADVFPVATCDLNQKMWYYSSRGPGQYFGQNNTSKKPDATAPTPRNGKILYGDSERVLSDGWGTSGACPQAAGLAALMLSLNTQLSRDDIFNAIRSNSVDIGFSHECQGYGMIDCLASVEYIRNQLTV